MGDVNTIMKKRAFVYFAYDAQGVMDDYIFYAIEKVKPFVAHTIVVINGKLQDKYRGRLENCADELVVRDNIGFDVWAYKTAIDSIGWDGLEAYDELILMNYTIMGPLYDLTDMFSEMDQRDVDFWGITKCFEEKSPQALKQWGNPYGYIPEHIQSSFCVFRKSLFSADVFHDLWDNMPMITSYYESGGTYEQVITKKFADLGYTWDCYTDYSTIDPEWYGCCPLITAPLVVNKELKSPFFKRRSFFTSKMEFAAVEPNIRGFWSFLENETDYGTKMTMDNLIRSCNQRDIVESLLLLHPVGDHAPPMKEKGVGAKIGIFACTENIVDLDRLKRTLAQYESSCDVWYSEQANMDVKTLCTGVGATYDAYDYVVLINPGEATSEHEILRNYTARQNYSVYGLLENGVLPSAIDLMERDETIGLLTLPVDYLQAANWEEYEDWEDYYHVTKTWERKNKIHIPIDVSRPPVLSYGACVIRIKAIQEMGSLQFNFFSAEFMGIAAAILCQHNGYIPQYITPESFMINNYFGYETYTNWIPKVLEVKKEYYKQTINYRKETIQYYEKDNQVLRDDNQALRDDNQALRTCNQALEAQCAALTENAAAVKDSLSWRITAPLRSIFQKKVESDEKK